MVTGHRRLVTALLVLWALTAAAAMGTLAVNHTAALPAIAGSDRLAQAVQALRRPGAARRMVVHVVAQDCSCARNLLDHLLHRAPLPDTDEVLLYVGPGVWLPDVPAARGLRVLSLTARELHDRFGLDAAPVLVAVEADGRLDYLGGYFDHPSALHPRDQAIHAAWLAGRRPAPLPVFGCAVEASLRERLDPLGLVYRP